MPLWLPGLVTENSVPGADRRSVTGGDDAGLDGVSGRLRGSWRSRRFVVGAGAAFAVVAADAQDDGAFFVHGVRAVGRTLLQSVARPPDGALPPRMAYWFAPPLSWWCTVAGGGVLALYLALARSTGGFSRP